MEHLLTKLKAIEPNKEFKERSRALILNTPQAGLYPRFISQFIQTIQLGTAFSLTAIFIFLMIGGISILNRQIFSPAILSGLDPKNLNEEAANLEIQIQLSQAEYYENSAEKIEVALKETSDELRNSKNREEKLNRLLDEITL